VPVAERADHVLQRIAPALSISAISPKRGGIAVNPPGARACPFYARQRGPYPSADGRRARRADSPGWRRFDA